MNRIHALLEKAERDGHVRRTRGLEDAPTPVETVVSFPPEPPFRDDFLAIEMAVGEPAGDLETFPSDARADLDRRLVAAVAPLTPAAEQYRLLRTRINRPQNGRALQLLLVTSPGKGDGKSLNAANLALSMAQEYQRRVVLVDADLRSASLHRLFDVPPAPGLAEVLLGQVPLDEALVTVPEHHLSLLPAGTLPAHPAELLSSTAMARLLESLRQQFDRIVLDAPPAPLADAGVLSPHVDGILVIVRAGMTQKPAIQRALGGFERGKILGLVLNDLGRDGSAAYSAYTYTPRR